MGMATVSSRLTRCGNRDVLAAPPGGSYARAAPPMIVQCEHCKTKFRLADDRVSQTGVKVRCSKCAHVFTVSRTPEARVEARLLEGTGSERPMSPAELSADLAGDLMLPGPTAQSSPLTPPPFPSFSGHPGAMAAPATFGAPLSFGGPAPGSAGMGAPGLGGAPPAGAGFGAAGASGYGAPPGFGSPPAGQGFGAPGASGYGPPPTLGAGRLGGAPPLGAVPPTSLSGSLGPSTPYGAGLGPLPPSSLGGVPPTGLAGKSPTGGMPPYGPPSGSATQALGGLPPLPFDVGPPPPVSRSGPPPSRTSPGARPPPSIPAGRPPPGQSLPSVPQSMLDADPSSSGPFIDLDVSASGRVGVRGGDVSEGDLDLSTELAPRPARASTEVDAARGPLLRAPTQVDPTRSPPQARAPTELDPLRARGVVPPPSMSPQSIRAPTFPPPPVFDPHGGGLPLDSIAPPPPPPPPPKIPPADSDRFALPRPHDALADLAAAENSFGPGLGDQLGQDLSFETPDEQGGAKLARIDLKRGLLGQAGFSQLGAANEATTRIAAGVTARPGPSDVPPELVAITRPPAWRSVLLLAVLFLVVAVSIALDQSRQETRVGQPSLIDTLTGRSTAGSLAGVYISRARVTAYPLHDPRPRLVVSGLAAHEGELIEGALDVVASMLDGERVVAQSDAPLGALLPLDVLARATSTAALDAAWAKVPPVTGPWPRGEPRPFMVVFPELPTGVEAYTFRVELRPAPPRMGQR